MTNMTKKKKFYKMCVQLVTKRLDWTSYGVRFPRFE